MKKILLILISIITVLILTGCNLNKTSRIKVDVLNSEIDYFVFRDKKIYLTENLEQYVMQFQSLGCKLNNNLDIDNIKTKEHEFYQLTDEGFDITCPNDQLIVPGDFFVWVSPMSSEQYGLKSVERDIYYWSISGGISESIDVYFNGKKIIIYGENSSKKDDIIKVLGSDYEYEEDSSNGYYDLIYSKNGYEYNFAFDEAGELFSLRISIS